MKAPGTAKKMVFLDLVRSETVVVWSSPAESKYEKVESGRVSPTEMVAEILGVVEKLCLRGCLGEDLSLRGREVKEDEDEMREALRGRREGLGAEMSLERVNDADAVMDAIDDSERVCLGRGDEERWGVDKGSWVR